MRLWLPPVFTAVLLACATGPDGIDAGSDAGINGTGDAGVDGGSDAGPDAGGQEDAGVDAGPLIRFGSFNLEFFGDPTRGPANEALQIQNAAEVIRRADAQVWGLQEIVDPASFDQLLVQLPGYAGVLVTDHLVHDGASAWDQTPPLAKLAVLYRASQIRVHSARVLREVDFGRPPLEVTLSAEIGGVTSTYLLIVVHLYPFAEEASWQRRKAAAEALKAYLDSNHPDSSVIVVGDWNDDVDESIVDAGYPSPFAALVLDGARYSFPTAELSSRNEGTTVAYSSTIDHHLVTNELAARYRLGSSRVERPWSYLPDYRNTTSDHYPTLTDYSPAPAGLTPRLRLLAPNGGEWVDGHDTLRVVWDSDALSTVHLEHTLDDGLSWTRFASDVPTSTGSWCWRAPNQSTVNARLRVSSAEGVPLSDASNGYLRIDSRADAVSVLINEVMVAPTRGPGAEFVELVNLAPRRVDLGRWTLDDSEGTVHRFDCGVRLEPGRALVVYGGAAEIPQGQRHSVAAAGNLFLDDAGDTVKLQITPALVADEMSWSSAPPAEVSLNRNPDGTAGAPFAEHDTLAAAPASPGVRSDGGVF